MNHQLKLALVLFVSGFLGVLSLLTSESLTGRLPPELTQQFTPTELRLLSLVNSTVLLVAAVAVGLAIYRQVDLRVPLAESYLLGQNPFVHGAGMLKTGLAGGLLAGITLLATMLLFRLGLEAEFQLMADNLRLSTLARLLYGGITEEILLRFGFMSLVVWGLYKVTKKKSPAVYLTGIFVSALLFALAHLPVAFQILTRPSPGFIAYILVGNTAGGLIFGWIYWKKGLEAAMISHMAAHITLMAAGF